MENNTMTVQHALSNIDRATVQYEEACLSTGQTPRVQVCVPKAALDSADKPLTEEEAAFRDELTALINAYDGLEEGENGPKGWDPERAENFIRCLRMAGMFLQDPDCM